MRMPTPTACLSGELYNGLPIYEVRLGPYSWGDLISLPSIYMPDGKTFMRVSWSHGETESARFSDGFASCKSGSCCFACDERSTWIGTVRIHDLTREHLEGRS